MPFTCAPRDITLLLFLTAPSSANTNFRRELKHLVKTNVQVRIQRHSKSREHQRTVGIGHGTLVCNQCQTNVYRYCNRRADAQGAAQATEPGLWWLPTQGQQVQASCSVLASLGPAAVPQGSPLRSQPPKLRGKDLPRTDSEVRIAAVNRTHSWNGSYTRRAGAPYSPRFTASRLSLNF